MFPKRESDILDGGSLYWVIKGSVQCRQKIVDLRQTTGADGISRCNIVLDHQVVPTHWQPRRAFQGWRYLEAKDAPADLVNIKKVCSRYQENCAKNSLRWDFFRALTQAR